MTAVKTAPKTLAGAALIFLAAMALSACQEDPGGFVMYEPGVYKGAADTAITDDARARLRAHARRQGG